MCVEFPIAFGHINNLDIFESEFSCFISNSTDLLLFPYIWLNAFYSGR